MCEYFGDRIEQIPLLTIAYDLQGVCSFGDAPVGQHIGGSSSILTAS